MLIQLLDPASFPPTPKAYFKESHQLEFLDVEDDVLGTPMEDFAVTKYQAQHLVKLLQRAIDQQMDVVVHCTAGICRSGAVTEVAVSMLGFEEVHTSRIPNLRVKRLMFEALGLGYEHEVG